MEDINDIYEPIYRETSKSVGILIIIAIVVSIVILTIFIINKLKNKNKPVTQMQKYQNVLNNLTKLQADIENISSYEFSTRLSKIYKNYLSSLYNKNYTSDTAEELFYDLNEEDCNLKFLFVNYIEPSLFGKKNIKIEDRRATIKECVENITNHYNANGEKID